MNNNKLRPLSPHLTIHKKVQTAILSIMHRITGFGLNIGILIIVLWLSFFAFGEEYFNIITSFNNTIIAKVIFFIWSFSLFFHLINGIRYLVWSVGYGIDIKNINISGYFVIFFSFLLTILIWMIF